MNKRQRVLEALGVGFVVWGITSIPSASGFPWLELGALAFGLLTIWLA